MDDDINALSANLAKVVAKATGLINIRGSATKLIREALKLTKEQWGG